jgi:hypothetical protein
MIDFNTSTRLSRRKQHFFLNDSEVSGVQSVVSNFNVPVKPIVHLGMSELNYTSDGPVVGQVQLTSYFLSHDHFIDKTGDVGFNGYLLENNSNIADNFSFTSGYLAQYSHTCSVGDIPQINANMVVFGKIGKIPTTAGEMLDDSPSHLTDIQNNAGTTYPLRVIAPGSIEIDFKDELTTNRVNSYSISVTSNRNPLYVLGKRYPASVELTYPVEVQCNFNMDITRDNFAINNNFDSPCTPNSGDLTITVKDYHTNEIVNQYHLPNLRLTDQSYNVGAGANANVSLTYKTYLLRP